MSELTESLERSLQEVRNMKLNEKIDILEGHVVELYETAIDSKYSREIYWSEEDQIFVVKISELEFCVSHGKTIIEAVIKSEIAIKDWIDHAKTLGKDIPKPLNPELSEDERELISYDLAMDEFKKDPVTYSTEEVRETLGLVDDDGSIFNAEAKNYSKNLVP